ncbi:sensor histidine kinase [Salinibacter altiplanensis]|uniref:sensor histidine kinase n=1 Tax=Salinibacter altiplanensis TaxID=1803181 RepID=UPI000C9FDD03|nr:histidine kinase [Salinibacter altiplanensis]
MSDRSGFTSPSRVEWGLVAAFWATVALLSVGQTLLGDVSGEVHWGRMAGELIEYTLWGLFTPVVFWFAKALPVVEPTDTKQLTVARNASLHLAVALATSVVVDLSEDAVEAALGERYIAFVQSLSQFWFTDELVVYLVILMAGFARSYYFQQKARQEEAARLEERAEALQSQLTEARLEALRMQLNPHFLFNTLHAVSTLVDRDPAGVRRMIARLSELLRHVLDEEAPQEVPLSQELEFLDDYFEIQSIRFQGRLDTAVDVPSSLRDAQVPNLILQPIVENAIKHGASQVRGVGRIEVRGRREDDRLVLTVTDNGPGLPASQEDGLGLRNVRARLEGLYGEPQTLHLETVPDKGTRAVLKLPYHTRASLYAAAGTSSPPSSVPDSDLD